MPCTVRTDVGSSRYASRSATGHNASTQAYIDKTLAALLLRALDNKIQHQKGAHTHVNAMDDDQVVIKYTSMD